MPVTESIGRRQCIPILYTRGTHYEVGFDVGRNFEAIIHSFLRSCSTLHEAFLPAYNTPEGRKAFDDTLNCVKANFPQYIEELQGTADGAKAPFHELFLLHMDNIILSPPHEGVKQAYGCSTICVNREGQEVLGHTEDALDATLNHFYFVSAHIISDKPQGRWNVKEEKFTSLCYAGHLPGYTMNYNHHGVVFSINTVTAKVLVPGKTPRHFLTRALLSAENYTQALQILKDEGNGAADGCSINMTFLEQEGERIFYNIEMAPATDGCNESQLDVVRAVPGEHILHCNSYLRMPTKQGNVEMLKSSNARMATFQQSKDPRSQEDVINMLGDNSNQEFPVFRDSDFVRTIAVGIFNCSKKTWTLYSDNPKEKEPLVVLPLVLKSK